MRLAGLLLWLVALAAQPAFAQTGPGLQLLEQRLATMAQENPGEYGIAALDLSTGMAGSNALGVTGYAPDHCVGLVKNIVVWAAARAPRPAQ